MFRILKGLQRRNSGSDDIFEELLVKNLDHLFAFALRLSGNRESAEDLVQEAALKAFQNFYTLRSPSHFKGWIFQILRNAFINRIESHRPQPLAGEDGWKVNRGGENPVFNEVLRSELRQAVDTLPPPFRETLWLSDVEGFSHREISEILDCSMGTVASRLHRARCLLREVLVSGCPLKASGGSK